MRNLLVVAIVLAAALPASAREGFYIGLGLGPTGVGGEEVADRLQADEQGNVLDPGGLPITTDIPGGLSGNFRLGFNILGHAAIETQLSGHGKSLGDIDKRSWAAHWHTGVRAYPMWTWQKLVPEYLQPFEPSIFLGWGASYTVYTPVPGADELGFSKWGSWRWGLGLEYFVITYFKVMAEYSYVRASYGNFIFNLEDSLNFPVEPAAKTGYHQFYLLALFQFGPAQEPVRYAAQ